MTDNEFAEFIATLPALDIIGLYHRYQQDLHDMHTMTETEDLKKKKMQMISRSVAMQTEFERKIVAINRKYVNPNKDMKNET